MGDCNCYSQGFQEFREVTVAKDRGRTIYSANACTMVSLSSRLDATMSLSTQGKTRIMTIVEESLRFSHG